MIPIPLRKEARDARKQIKKTEPRRRQANPATYFIMIFVLIGSFGIHFISLRHRYQYHSRQLDNRIAKLQQVLRRVQAGEDVDVETALGTGNAVAEKEWEEGMPDSVCSRVFQAELTWMPSVMERIREEDRLWSSKERKKARKQARKEAREAAEAAMQAEKSTKSSDQFAQTTDDFGRIDEQRTKNKRTPGFY